MESEIDEMLVEVIQNATEKALSKLFGKGEERLGIVINAEFMPPDFTNTERALRLNPREALNEWLEEIAEELHIH